MELCPDCGEDHVAEARYCEACGASVTGEVNGGEVGGGPAVGRPEAKPTGTSDAAPGCVQCGAVVGDDGYCTSCGLRALEAIAVEDQDSCAYATHRGRRHPRNEDAATLATTSEGWPVVVVADGVSASPNPHLAAAAAVAAVAGELDGQPFTGPDHLRQAILVAHEAASEVPAEGDPLWTVDGTHPACTIVIGVATADGVHVANIGDARAYLVTAGEERSAVQMSTDDSVAALAVREGIEPAAALTLPGGHAITAWLGADAPAPKVHLATRAAAPGDLLLACSDGLWNYAPTDESLAERVNAALPARPEPVLAAKACEELVAWAIDQGGSDNICVALAPATTDAAPSEQEDQAS